MLERRVYHLSLCEIKLNLQAALILWASVSLKSWSWAEEELGRAPLKRIPAFSNCSLSSDLVSSSGYLHSSAHKTRETQPVATHRYCLSLASNVKGERALWTGTQKLDQHSVLIRPLLVQFLKILQIGSSETRRRWTPSRQNRQEGCLSVNAESVLHARQQNPEFLYKCVTLLLSLPLKV